MLIGSDIVDILKSLQPEFELENIEEIFRLLACWGGHIESVILFVK